MAPKTWKPGLPRPLAKPAALVVGLTLVFEQFSPDIPVEGRPIDIGFSITNSTADAVSGWVGALGQGADGSITNTNGPYWRVTDLHPGSTVRGTQRIWAPSANLGNRGYLYFFDHIDGEFGTSPVLAEAFQGFDSQGRFVLSVEKIKCHNPRSTDTDSNYAVLSALLGGEGPLCNGGVTCVGQFIGQFGSNQEKTVSISLPPVDVAVTDPTPSFNLAVMNSGDAGKADGAQKILNSLSAAAKGFLDGYLPAFAGLWDAADKLTQLIDGALAGCDGPVLNDNISIPPAILFSYTSDPKTPVGLKDSPIRHGQNSPGLCGMVSNYSYTSGFRRIRSADDTLYVEPSFVQLAPGRKVAFKYKHAPKYAALWRVEGGVANGTITADGIYTAPSGINMSLPYVTITSTGEDSQVAHAYVATDACIAEVCGTGKCGSQPGCGGNVDCGSCGVPALTSVVVAATEACRNRCEIAATSCRTTASGQRAASLQFCARSLDACRAACR